MMWVVSWSRCDLSFLYVSEGMKTVSCHLVYVWSVFEIFVQVISKVTNSFYQVYCFISDSNQDVLQFA